ncbi:type II toxin-antitoxin system RatA family toxin [Saccharothrix coeruleofusca]|uniref:Coenzyme Q-binding protein COQ10 START domain-containing protein n=1 Tax=Saccharothrix coeruleofusca TaxID=33919 RepID=A0A918APT9_9PSEU|nr:SRPBCC family protein [Saccharothrix coeruleofusca]GGP67949.1 hypothetical protein GCM10010185_45880 [Saccharothrix coeruleofusca]
MTSEHTVVLTTPAPAGEVFAALRRQERFPEVSADILAVTAEGDDRYRYELRFRGGVARWVQRVEVDDAARVLRFEQVEGDFAALGGAWEVTPTGDGSEVAYRVSFRTSIPHLAGAIDPMIARVLLRAAVAVVTGLVDRAQVVDDAAALRDELSALG